MLKFVYWDLFPRSQTCFEMCKQKLACSLLAQLSITYTPLKYFISGMFVGSFRYYRSNEKFCKQQNWMYNFRENLFPQILLMIRSIFVLTLIVTSNICYVGTVR